MQASSPWELQPTRKRSESPQRPLPGRQPEPVAMGEVEVTVPRCQWLPVCNHATWS